MKTRSEILFIQLKKLRNLQAGFQRQLSRFNLPEYTTHSLFAIFTGALAGLAAVLFHDSIDSINELFFKKTAGGLFFLGAGAVIVLPAIGMLIQSLMIKMAEDTSKRRGVSEVIKAVALRGGYIPLRTTIFHFIAPVICIGSGGTVGPEGPAAQLGGGLASKIGNLFGLSDSKRRMFTAAGAGAAIAAIFNTPLGGIFFALEIILLNDFQSPTFSALILASVTASAISRIFLGNVSVFHFSIPDTGGYENLYLFIILGILSGILSLLFIRYSSSTEKLFNKIILKRIPQWIVMVLIGLLVGFCGYFYHEIFGIGYEAINHLLSNSLTWKVAAILLAMKFILVPLILNSGGFGGLFAPSLFMGACLGFIFAALSNLYLGTHLDITTFVLVGMGAVLGGINSIPISAILIIFEMTKNYSFILPLMLAVVISTTLVQIVIKGSVHVKHLEHQGFQIRQGREVGILKSKKVLDTKLDQILTVPENVILPKLVTLLMDSPHNTFYTMNKNNKLTGIITGKELRPIITEYENLHDMVVASDIANPEVVKVKSTDDLDYVLRLFGKRNVNEFPVVDADDPQKILGVITRQEVISVYNKESIKYNLTDGLAEELRSIEHTKSSKVADGFSIVEITSPEKFIGKSLLELRFRNKYGIEVLMIKKSNPLFDADNENIKLITPDPNYVIERDDTLVLFGRDENIAKIREL